MGASVTLPSIPAAVKAVYDAYPKPASDQLLKLRTLIFDNREIRLPLDTPLPLEPLRHCIAMALTYRKRKPVS